MMRAMLWACAMALSGTAAAQSGAAMPSIDVDWTKTLATTRTTITLQVVENPPLRRGSAIHDAAWKNLALLNTDMTRLALWYPYPRLSVAELEKPAAKKTSWDFSAIDPIVEDFFRATSGHSSVFTMSTLPAWMFCDATTQAVPASADEAMWSYEAGERLCDASGQQAADYFARVAGWYTRGGFRDELGQWHASAHHERLAWWEVLNEPEYEHSLDMQTYTRVYDRVTAAVHAVSPETKFVGMSLAEPMRSPAAFEYFLDPAHHAPGTPLDAISFHFYADAEAGETDATEAYTFFDQADAFVNSVRFITAMRDRLSPRTQIHVNEAGCISASDLHRGPDIVPAADSPYWQLCGAVFAYLYGSLAAEGVDVLSASQLVGYPTQFPSVTMLDWRTGEPNARYRVLQLLHRSFTPGDTVVPVSSSATGVAVFAFAHGHQKSLLLINKRPLPVRLRLRGWKGAKAEQVGLASNGYSNSSWVVADSDLPLDGYGVMVVGLAAREGERPPVP